MKPQKAKATTLLINTAISIIFIIIELVAANHIGYENLLAWLLAAIAGWHLLRIILTQIGMAKFTAEAINKQRQPTKEG